MSTQPGRGISPYGGERHDRRHARRRRDTGALRESALEDRTFVALVAAISLAFAWILWPFYAPVFWAIVLATLFAPLQERISASLGNRRTIGSLMTVAIIVALVILPTLLVTGLLLQEALGVYGRIRSGELDFGRYLQQVIGALPGWLTDALDRFGLTDLAALREKLSSGFMKGIQFVGSQALSVGQNTLDFVVTFILMLYLLFFLLRDGGTLRERIRNAIPLQRDLQRDLASTFTNVIRATIRGSVVVALAQGLLGGLIFWLLGIHAPILWGVVMAFLSLLPALGTALVWLPVAVYLLVIGEVGKGLILVAYGVLVIGLVDNVLRPILVGRETSLPDYVVLISTLGGMVAFGVTGFVIGPVIAALFIAAWDVVGRARAAQAS